MKEEYLPSKSTIEKVVALRREIHRHPELSEHETNTLALIRRTLDGLGISYEICPANGGIVASIGSGDRAVGLRADIDALPMTEITGLPYASENPGVMHACGHDVHTAALLGVAMELKAIESSIHGVIKLFFQPAEETVGGAKPLIDFGCMENPHVEHVFSFHVDPKYEVGKVMFLPGRMNAAVVDMSIRVKGVACHGAHPEQGVDSIVAASAIVSALQTVNSRFTAPTTPSVVTVGTINGGTKNNIIAGEVFMRGTVRALDDATASELKRHISRLAENTARAYGAEAEVTLTDDYPALVNDKAVTRRLMALASEMLGADNVIEMEVPSLGADDFAYFAQKAPSSYFNVGTTTPGMPLMSLHTPDFAPDEACIPIAVAMLVNSALTFLEERI